MQIIKRDNNVHIRLPSAACQPLKLAPQMGSTAADSGDDGSPHDALTVAYCRAVTSMARAARAAAPDTRQRVHLSRSLARAWEISPGHARTSGQLWATVANRCWRNTVAVADCSSKGRGWAITTAPRLAAATSAIAL